MTLFTGLPALSSSPPNVPSIGDILYLSSYVFKVGVTATQTMPDTPPMYSANIGIVGDTGSMNIGPLAGPPGAAGVANFTLRDQTDTLPLVNTVDDLPDDLTDTTADVGKYWLIDTLDDTGHVTMVTAYVWYGDEYRTFMSGSFGPPGPIPEIQLDVAQIPPTQKSYVLTSGSSLQPSWDFFVASPQGPSGISGYLGQFPDIDEFSGAPAPYDILAYTGGHNSAGQAVWEPVRVDQGIVGPFSMPEAAFQPFNGVSQQAGVGSYAIPQQPFPWTPVVWGHIGGSGISLSADPFMVGCEVLLGNQTQGAMISRGIGNTLGVVNVIPHYSQAGNTSASITPKNQTAVVPPYHTGNEGTIYINLYNDGAEQVFAFSPASAQLFIMVVPIEPPFTSITGVPCSPYLSGSGALSGTAIAGSFTLAGAISGQGTLGGSADSWKFILHGPQTGHGRLNGSAVPIEANPALAGHGSLHPNIRPPVTPPLSGHGQLGFISIIW